MMPLHLLLGVLQTRLQLGAHPRCSVVLVILLLFTTWKHHHHDCHSGCPASPMKATAAIIKRSQWDILNRVDWWHGELPPWPVSCRRLTTIQIVCFRGHVFSIYIQGKDLTESLPRAYELAHLPLLQFLSMDNISFSSQQPAFLFNMTKLRYLYLTSDTYPGSLPASISRLSKLRLLSLSSNAMSGTLPTAICALRRLLYLEMNFNTIGGSLPECMKQLRWLHYLQLSNNLFSGTIPTDMFESMRRLIHLFMNNNSFSGALPPSLTALTSATILDVSDNFMSESLPGGLSAIKSLQALRLSNNQLSGPIPQGLSALLTLEELSLSHNRLSGTIPVSLTALTRLGNLDVSFNQLTGPIPASLAAVRSLANLAVSHNRLTGAVPGLRGIVDAADNFFTSLAPLLIDRLCFSSDPNINDGTSFQETCLPPLTASNGTACNSSGVWRSDGLCNTTCAVHCKGSGACYVIGDSMVQVCPCDAASYVSITPPYPCKPLDDPLVSLCLTPSNFFLQSFALSGSAAVRDASITFSLSLTSFPSLGRAFLPSPVTLFPPDSCTPYSFATSFTFRIKPSSSRATEGGFTFAILAAAPNTLRKWSILPRGGLGYAGSGTGIAVEFDVSKDVWDPDGNHIGVNAGGRIASVATANPTFTMKIGFQIHVWIDFAAATLSVFASLKDEKPSSAVLRVPLDLCTTLRRANASLQEAGRYHIGFTSQARSLRPAVTIQDWCFATGDNPDEAPVLGLTSTLPLGLIISPSVLLGAGNYISRYSSVGFTAAQDGSDSWLIRSFSTWNTTSWMNAVQDQGGCAASWAYATVDAVATAFAILNNPSSSSPPFLPASQLLTTPAATIPPCGGGCPTVAMQYLTQLAVQGGGLRAAADSEGSSLKSSPVYSVVSFERTSFFGWFGLLLAVQRQPVVVHIQADAPSFVAYDGSFVYRESSCYRFNLNHVVMVVGYSIASRLPPYWIIRNSWGKQWGDGGYMRMGITGGDGICGINVLPGIYPIVNSASDPCFSSSWRLEPSDPPSLSPCGSFACHADPHNTSTNICDCALPFVQVTLPEGSRTCAYVDVCSASSTNPCQPGTCRNTGDGAFTCLCPHGYYLGTTVEGLASCAPSEYIKVSQTFTVASESTLVEDICATFDIPIGELVQQNPQVDFSSAIPVGTTLIVAPSAVLPPCSVYYAPATTDSCDRIQAMFQLSAVMLSALNPGLTCSYDSPLSPLPTVCVERGGLVARWSGPCTQLYQPSVQGDTCDTIRTSKALRAISWMDFYRYNPGINCNALLLPSPGATASSVEVCLGRKMVQSCGPHCQDMKVPVGSTCQGLMNMYFGNSPSRWTMCNPGFKCVDPIFGRVVTICVPTCMDCG